MSSLPTLLKNGLRTLGLTQRRCAHCLRPFIPERSDVPDSVRNLAAQDFLCPQCLKALPRYLGSHCPRCGLPATDSEQHSNVVCGACLQQPPPWRGLAFHGLYAGDLRDMLLRLKFDGQLYLAKPLGTFLQEAAACLSRPDGVLAVPQHPDHLRRRGYNQAHELARALCNLSGLSLRTDLLHRPLPGPAQAGLSAMARRDNVRHSFAASPAAAGLHLWIIDDVMTTGSTLRAATEVLCMAGAKSVDVLFVARTPRLP